MPSIGDYLAAAQEAELDENPDEERFFTLAGEKIRVHPAVSAAVFLRSAALVRDIDPTDVRQIRAANNAAVADALEDVIYEDDFPRFLHLVKKHRVDMSTVELILSDVMEAETGRPTERPDDSDGGPSSTSPKSSGKSSGSARGKRGKRGTAREGMEAVTPENAARLASVLNAKPGEAEVLTG